MRRVPHVAVASSLVLLAACSPEDAVFADRPFCAADLQLTVSTGTTPTFDWNDGCRVWSLRVEQVDPSRVVWSMGEDDESLDAPIVYGQLPPGAGEFEAAQALQSGVAYRALLVQRSNGGRILAETRFTP